MTVGPTFALSEAGVSCAEGRARPDVQRPEANAPGGTEGALGAVDPTGHPGQDATFSVGAVHLPSNASSFGQ